MVEGEVIYQNGKFTKVDKEAALAELAGLLKAPRTEAEERRRVLAREVFPYVKKFYDGWLDHHQCDPFYCQSCRH
jgi:hypothetical protein